MRTDEVPPDESVERSADEYGREILTVGQLKKILDRFEDDRHVVIATDGWYQNVEAVGLPDDDTYICVTLFPGSEFDTRQF